VGHTAPGMGIRPSEYREYNEIRSEKFIFMFQNHGWILFLSTPNQREGNWVDFLILYSDDEYVLLDYHPGKREYVKKLILKDLFISPEADVYIRIL